MVPCGMCQEGCNRSSDGCTKGMRNSCKNGNTGQHPGGCSTPRRPMPSLPLPLGASLCDAAGWSRTFGVFIEDGVLGRGARHPGDGERRREGPHDVPLAAELLRQPARRTRRHLSARGQLQHGVARVRRAVLADGGGLLRGRAGGARRAQVRTCFGWDLYLLHALRTEVPPGQQPSARGAADSTKRSTTAACATAQTKLTNGSQHCQAR